MDINNILLSLTQATCILSLYYFLFYKIRYLTSINYVFFNYIFFYHLFFVIIYFIYITFDISDAKSIYYKSTITSFSNFVEIYDSIIPIALGLNNSILTSKFFYSFFNLTFFSMTILYALISLSGVLLMCNAVNKYFYQNNQRINQLYISFFFFPSIHFWQISISKDAIVFFGISLFIYSLFNIRKYYIFFVISILMVFAFRPYIVPIFVFSSFIYLCIDSKIKLIERFLLLIIGLISLIFLMPIAVAYIGISPSNIFDIKELIYLVKSILTQAYENASQQDAGLDKKSMSYYQHFFIYLFYPLDFLNTNLMIVASSIENLILFFYILILIITKDLKTINKFQFSVFLIFIILFTILAIRTSNLGISMRQKWMVIPFLYFFLINFKNKYHNA
jgi:hypothetical protein